MYYSDYDITHSQLENRAPIPYSVHDEQLIVRDPLCGSVDGGALTVISKKHVQTHKDEFTFVLKEKK